MRFAIVVTAVAAVIALPLAAGVSGPQMSSNEFISAVRCTAYAVVAGPEARLSEAKYQLNAEARRQSPETTAQAQAEVQSIVRTAATAEPGTLRQAQTAACVDAHLAGGVDAGRA